MAFDRQSIERRDFPIARRGYDIEAVDAHLATLADEYEETARRGRASGGGGLASSAADQVRMIVEAAEQSAADIEREAALEARQLRQDAREEAERVRGDAGRQAREHVTRVAEVARGLLDRVEAMDRELGGLLDGLRAGTQRLAADLSLLQGSVGEVREAAATAAPGGEGPAPDESSPAAASPPDEDGRLPAISGRPLPAEEDGAAVASAAPLQPSPPLEAPDPPVAARGAAEASEPAAWEPDEPRPAAELDGARMVALNMALNGVPREDTQHHIESNFELDDVHALLDEVYMRAGQ
jgi:DivIVA domain-containing protein